MALNFQLKITYIMISLWVPTGGVPSRRVVWFELDGRGHTGEKDNDDHDREIEKVFGSDGWTHPIKLGNLFKCKSKKKKKKID